MSQNAIRPGSRLMDRPEYKSKQMPLTKSPDTNAFDAVIAMSKKNYGSVVVIDSEKKVIGVVTERDIMNKVVGKELNPKETDRKSVV